MVIALVTGGGSGIGESICRRLSADGAFVAVLDRRGSEAERVAASVDGFAIEADVANPDEVAGAVEHVMSEYGHLDWLVNNAGIGNVKRLEAYSPAEVDLIWSVNVAGVYNCLRSAAPHLHASGGAAVNIASVSGVRPTMGEAPYSAAKAAVIALTSSAALEWAPHVRVNCVSPGFIRTPLNEMLASEDDIREGIEARTPAHRLGTDTDVASAVAFLLSADSAYMTGQNLVLDGGSTLNSKQMDPVLEALLTEQL